MGLLKYKGYTGSVDYSEEDNCLYGKVLGMSKDMITYEGQDVNELRKDFEGAIDDYLALCKANGKAPRVPEIHSRIAMMAMQAGTTINGFIRDTLANVTGVTPATNA